jgi:hypothetical protein
MTGMLRNKSACTVSDPAKFSASVTRSKACWAAFPAIVAEKIRQKLGR